MTRRKLRPWGLVLVMVGWMVLTVPEGFAVDTREVPEPSPFQVLAGLRAYPDDVLDALLKVVNEPLLLQQLIEEPDKLEDPSGLYPPLSEELQQAVAVLQPIPELLILAGDHPEAIAQLGKWLSEALEELRTRIAELRRGYRRAGLAAAGEWERRLQTETRFRTAYGELVTRFCRQQLQEYPAFPCVEVLDARYYDACPPNELIIAFAREQAPPGDLVQVLEHWWSRFAPEEIDRLAERSASGADAATQTGPLAYAPASERAAMWRPIAGNPPGEGKLLPVIMQPEDDQPPEARLAYAVAEHARLWSGGRARGTVARPADASEPTASGAEDSPPARDEPWMEAPLPVEPLPAPATEIPPLDQAYAWDEDAYVEDRTTRYVATRTNIFYVGAYPYYYCYPVTWPVVYTCLPTYYRETMCGSRYGYGASTWISYGDRGFRVGFHLGSGRTLYYDCPTRHRRVYRRTVRHRTWRNYGAPYGGPYWVNYGAPYGEHGGYVHEPRRQPSIVVRPRHSLSRYYGSWGVIRTPAGRETRDRSERGEYGLRRVPRASSRGRTGTGVTRPHYGTVRRPTFGGLSTPRRSSERHEGTRIIRPRQTSARSGPSQTRVRIGDRLPRVRTGHSHATSRSGVRATTPRPSTRNPVTRSSSGNRRRPSGTVVRPSGTRSPRSSSVTHSTRRSSGSKVVRPSNPSRRPRGSTIRRPSRTRPSGGNRNRHP